MTAVYQLTSCLNESKGKKISTKIWNQEYDFYKVVKSQG